MKMATASQTARFCRLVSQRLAPASPRTRPVQTSTRSPLALRSFSSTPIARRAKDEDEDEDNGRRKVEEKRDVELKKLNAAFAESSTPEGLRQLDELAKSNGHNTIDDYVWKTLNDTQSFNYQDRQLGTAMNDVANKRNRSAVSLWEDEDDPDFDGDDHDVFDEDDITSMAHGKLDEVRDMRQYARLAVWEMPLLAQLAKPFVPPIEGKEVLRWRYTTYMGEYHPAEKKVVVEFSPDDLSLTPVQREKLKKLAGSRYNPEREIVKMSCESFEHAAQNKRHLSGLVDDLIAAARDPTDTFEDVPLDLRHHRVQPRAKFPKEWRMTPERAAELEAYRSKMVEADQRKELAGGLVDGQKLVDDALMQRMLEAEEAAKKKVAQPVTMRLDGVSSKMARMRR